MPNKPSLSNPLICIIGLGYVGLPLAKAFARRVRVIGFDVDKKKVQTLNQQIDNRNLMISHDDDEISKADFNIICVPTPVDKDKNPDLSAVKNAARIIGLRMKKGSVTILESTVYPGVTEEVVKPILEKESGMVCGEDFYIGYSPERINPGDDEHSVERVTKVVSGMNYEITDLVAGLYQIVTPNVFKAKNIKTAEAAKISENIQRDLNIALANELAVIFSKIGISSVDVFDAAATKWNYQRYKPGLVGGYCIPVVPYYLVKKSLELGHKPEVILAGRNMNNSMPVHIAAWTIQALKSSNKKVKKARVLVMGLTYKENISESRESSVRDLIQELQKQGADVFGYDMMLDQDVITKEFGVKVTHNLDELKTAKMDAVIITVPHTSFTQFDISLLKEIQIEPPILIDIPGIFKEKHPEASGFFYKTL